MLPPVASQFVAGETPAEAIDHVRWLNDRGVGAMVNRLGSHHRDLETARTAARAYQLLAADLADDDVDASLSVKPTQLGLSIGEESFRDLLADVAEAARERDVFVWLDMEEHTTIDATLDAYEDLATEHGGGVGVCVQASLRRTPEDVARLADVPGRVRFVKGATYDEPAAVAYQEKATVNRAYRELLAYAFERYDGPIAVASHDPEMVAYATELHEEYGTDVEFQMLMGVRTGAQFELAETYDVSQYVPYGTRWKHWFLNRVRNNVRFGARALVGAVAENGIGRSA